MIDIDTLLQQMIDAQGVHNRLPLRNEGLHPLPAPLPQPSAPKGRVPILKPYLDPYACPLD